MRIEKNGNLLGQIFLCIVLIFAFAFNPLISHWKAQSYVYLFFLLP